MTLVEVSANHSIKFSETLCVNVCVYTGLPLTQSSNLQTQSVVWAGEGKATRKFPGGGQVGGGEDQQRAEVRPGASGLRLGWT